mmetsp:Transcript_9533/g.22947  ORF Transcript_9533/g.22947 Transcript_9533/m.22947 type:complete len:285 (-) Transcript_9533:381-1235(-)
MMIFPSLICTCGAAPGAAPLSLPWAGSAGGCGGCGRAPRAGVPPDTRASASFCASILRSFARPALMMSRIVLCSGGISSREGALRPRPLEPVPPRRFRSFGGSSPGWPLPASFCLFCALPLLAAAPAPRCRPSRARRSQSSSSVLSPCSLPEGAPCWETGARGPSSCPRRASAVAEPAHRPPLEPSSSQGDGLRDGGGSADAAGSSSLGRFVCCGCPRGAYLRLGFCTPGASPSSAARRLMAPCAAGWAEGRPWLVTGSTEPCAEESPTPPLARGASNSNGCCT